jgi:hypothetical protein
MEQNWHDKINDYLDHLLDDQANQEMEQAIKKDPILNRAIREQVLIREAFDILKEDNARNEFRRWTSPPQESLPNRKSNYLVWLLGLILLFVIISFVWIYKPFFKEPDLIKADQPGLEPIAQQPVLEKLSSPTENKEDLKQEVPSMAQKSTPIPPNLNPEANQTPVGVQPPLLAYAYETEAQNIFGKPDINIFMRGQNRDTSILYSASRLYVAAKTKKDYLRVIALIEQIKQDNPDFNKSCYLKGCALFLTKQYTKAADNFASIRNLDVGFGKTQKWLEALSLYGAGAKDKERIKILLEELIAKPFPAEKKKLARDLLSKIQD